MTTEVLDIRPGISHPSKLAKSSETKISYGQDPDSPVGSIPFGKRVRDVTARGQCFIVQKQQVGKLVVYYESINRELKIKPIYECRCDGRLQTVECLL
jgi:hypothetical protein